MTQGEMGNIDVVIDGSHVTTMREGECVGELSLMYDSLRAATSRTATECKLWRIDRNDFKLTLRCEAQKELLKLCAFLKTAPLLQLLSDEERLHIGESLTLVNLAKNTVIIEEGVRCDDEFSVKFYILQSGSAAAFKQIDGKAVEVKAYRSNEYFGERALITNEPRAATFRAMTDCALLTLSRSAFVKTMGSVAQRKKSKMQSYEM
jgi:CRP-like cAMP-binding protein